jgi:hypothetical protein
MKIIRESIVHGLVYWRARRQAEREWNERTVTVTVEKCGRKYSRRICADRFATEPVGAYLLKSVAGEILGGKRK